MDNNILSFLEEYKNLDELCKQILSSDKGISTYIEEMEKERQGYWKVSGWEKDYNRLKKMRWIRNKLVHDPNSFYDNLFTQEDIDWIIDFHARIIHRTDPFSLLYQYRKSQEKVTNKPNTYQKSDYQPIHSSDRSMGNVAWVIFAGIILFVLIYVACIR